MHCDVISRAQPFTKYVSQRVDCIAELVHLDPLSLQAHT